MRNRIFCLMVFFAGILAPNMLKADGGLFGDGCFYIGALGGPNWLVQNHRQCCFKPKYEIGYGVGGLLGYKLCCYNIRFEVEGTYRRNDREHRKHHRRFVVDGIGSSSRKDRDKGHFESFSAMVNGYYDFDLCTCFTPYFGVGIGAEWDRFKFKNRRFRNLTGSSSSSSSRRFRCKHKDDTRFAAQAIAGVAYNISCNIDVSLDYRFHWSERNLYNHFVALGFKYYF